MLSYTFSTREKVLLAVLIIGVLVMAWYQLIFSNIQQQISSVDTQIAAAQDQLLTYQSRAAERSSMQETIDGYDEQGVTPVLLPDFDNTQNLMAYLHGVLGSTSSYDMSFSSPAISEEDGTVHRIGTIKFECTTYEQTRQVAEAIARGPYTCQVDALAIQAKRSRKSGEQATAYTATMQVTYFENAPADKDVSGTEETSGGQDLSKLKDWNK